MAVAMLCIMTLDQVCSSSEVSATREPADHRLTEILPMFVGVACKGLGLVGTLSNSIRQDVISSRRKDPLSRELLHTCVSLLTTLLSRERAPGTTVTGDKVYYASAAASLKRFGVIDSLVEIVGSASKLACDSGGSKDVSRGTSSFVADEDEVSILQSIFTLVRTIAEVGTTSPAILSTLSSESLSKMLVDNPLLSAASRHWISLKEEHGRGVDADSLPLRGYLPTARTFPVEMHRGEAQAIVSGPFLSGRDDPTHGVWRTALQILQTTVNACSNSGDEASHWVSRGFFDTATDFMRAHHSSLLDCLEQCASLPFDNQRLMSSASSSIPITHTVLTFNVLREGADILSLVSALCTGVHLNHFENSCSGIYHGMTKASHTVLASLSRFLGASGTARETFAALKEYDQDIRESANREQIDFRYDLVDNAAIHPLLLAGIPNARHEAIKHAHYATRCCALVTSADYAGLPAVSDTNTATPLSTSSLEHDCQLSINSPFVIRMEHAAADCVFHAVSVLSETHPASSCFVMFSADEAARLDLMSLLRTDMIMAVRPEPATTGVNRFCRIVQADTVHRQCHVRYLDETESAPLETVAADRVAGVEDMTKRKPILVYFAAPDSAAELDSAPSPSDHTASLGDLIVSLRWCLQYAGGNIDFNKSKTIRKTLAESASALLSTEVSLHGEMGTASKSDTNESSKRLLAQLLQLYDDPPAQSSDHVPRRSASLKTIISPSVWRCVQQQLEGELRVARDDRTEKRMQMAKRAEEANISSPWFNASRRHGGSTAFQGLFSSTR